LTRYTTPHLTLLTLLTTLASSLTNILYVSDPISAVCKACYYHIRQLFSLIPSQLAPLTPLSFTPNSSSVIIFTTTYRSLRLPASNRFKTLLLVLLLKLLNPVTSLLSYALFNERVECNLLSLTYKVLTTTEPPCLHNPISVQPPRSTRFSSLARPPTSSSLCITDLSLRYVSPCLWNERPSSLHQPHSSLSVSDLPVPAPTTSSHSVNSALTIRNSLCLSLPAQNLPLSQILPTIDSLPASELTTQAL